MARRPARHAGAVDDQPALPFCAPRLNWRRSMTSELQKPGRLGNRPRRSAERAEARNIVFTDAKVREFVAAAYGLDDAFGLLTDTLALTGARPSRRAPAGRGPARSSAAAEADMPKSAKGGGRNRVEKTEHYSVPITLELAAKLKAAAKGRADHAPLLLQSDGSPWAITRGRLSQGGQEDRCCHRCRS